VAKDEFGFEIKKPTTDIDEFGFPIKTTQPTGPDYSLGELASTSLKRGYKQTESLIGDVIPALGLSALGFDEAAERQMMEARATQEAIQRDLPAQFPSFRDVQWTNPLDVTKFVIEAMGENATNLIPVLGLGAYGTKVGATIGANIASKKAFGNLVDKKVSKKVRDRITTAASRKGADLGQVGGVFLGSYVLNAPETFRGIYEETGSFEPGAALLAGAVNASLDSIFPVTLLRSFRPSARAGIVGKVLEKSGMNPSLANGAVAKIFGSAAVEGVTEGSQEAVNITAENFVKDNKFVFESKDYERILEGAVKGAAAGGGYRAVGETVKGLTAEDTSPPPPPTTTTTTFDEDAKVIEAQRLNELGAVERVSREGEVKRLQAEFDEKITTEEGISDVINNMDKYFGNKTQEEINVIRNDLKKVRNNLIVQGEPIGKEKVKAEIEPQEKVKKLTKADKAKLKSLAKKTLASVRSYGSINSKKFDEASKSIFNNQGIEAAKIFIKEGERLSGEKFQLVFNKDGEVEPLEDAKYEAAELERAKREDEFDKESAQLKVNQRMIRNLKNRKDYTEKEKQELIKTIEENNKELKAIIKARPKAPTKDDALKKDILSFAEKEGKLSINAVSKELKAGARKTEVLLNELVKNGDLNLTAVKGRKVYTTPDYVEETKLKEKPKKEIKTYGGIPAAKPGAVGYQQKKSDTASRTATIDKTLKDIITLAGIPFVSGIARSDFRGFKNITPDTMDANLQKRIINELNTYAEDMYYNQQDSDGNTINRRASKESVFIAVNSANDINELADRRILSKETVEALKEYAQEVNDDINTRESRERDRGAATGAEQEGLRAGPTAPIQTAKKTATEVVDETDGDAVAATGPDTGQFTGGERGVYPTLNGAAVRWFVDGLPFGLKSLVGTYSIEKDSNGNDQGKITYDRKQVEREASIQDYANQPDYKISIDKDDVLKRILGTAEEQLRVDVDRGIIPPFTADKIRMAEQEKELAQEAAEVEKFTGTPRGAYPELESRAVEVIKPNGESITGIYEIQDELKIIDPNNIGGVKRKPQNIKPVGVIRYQQINKDTQLEEGENLNYKSSDFRDFLNNLKNKYGENAIVRKSEYVTSKDILSNLYNVETETERPQSLVPSTYKGGREVIKKISEEDIKKIKREMSRRAKLKREPKEELLIELDEGIKLKTTRKGDPRDKEIINKLKSKRTLGQALAILDKENITATQKELVTVLLSLPNIKSVRFNIVKDSDLEANTFGEYDVENNFIKVGVSGDVQAVLHEATHAATANQLTKHIAIDGKNKTPEGQRLIELYNTTVRAAGNRFEKELENIDEFVTNAFNNPEFQQFLADTESPFSTEFLISEARAKLTDEKASEYVKRNIADSYRGKPLEETIDSAWTGFVKAVKQIINPKKLDLRSSVLNDVIALAPELFVGPNPAEQAQGRQGKLFKKGDESKTISEENVKSLDIKVDPKEYEATAESLNEIKESDIDVDKVLSDERAFLEQAAGPHIVTEQDEILNQKHDVDMRVNPPFLSGDAAPITYSGPSKPTQLFNVISDHIKELSIAERGIGEQVANIFSRIPEGLGRIYGGFISLGQAEELYGNRLTSMGPLKRTVEAKASLNKKGYEEISYVVQYVEEVFSKYKDSIEGQELLKVYNNIILKLSGKDTDPEVMINEPNAEHVPSRKKLTEKEESTLQTLVGKDVTEAMLAQAKTKKQKEILRKFLDDIVDGVITIPAPYIVVGTSLYETKTNQDFLDANLDIATLVAQYDSLPQDLKDVTIRMVEDLRIKYQRLLDATIQNNPTNESKIRRQFIMRPYYFPFVRRGDYWYKYIDTETGEVGYGSAPSPSARELKMKEVEQQGIGTDVEISTRDKVATAGLGPNRDIEAFEQTILDSIKDLDFADVPTEAKNKIKQDFANTVRSNYLQLFPDQSLKQQQQHRKMVPGYIEDVLLSYSEVAPKITNSLANEAYNKEIIAHVNAIQKQANKEENRDNNIIKGIADSTLSGSKFFLNPIANLWAASAAYASYYWFLGLNPSSAIINLTQLPLVVFPYLEAEYKLKKTLREMKNASDLYFAGGREQTKFQDGSAMGQALNDLTMAPFRVNFKTGEKTYIGKNAKMFAPKGAKIEVQDKDGKIIESGVAKQDGMYYKVFNAAEESQTIRRGISYEATELSRQSGADLREPNRIKQKIDAGVGWMFQNSERANREITLVAAYNLEMETLLGANWKNQSRTSEKYIEADARATAKAIDLTVRAHSHALPEAGPEYFRTGLPKVMTIFKRFAQQQLYLISKMFIQLFPNSSDMSGMTKEQRDDYKLERKLAGQRLIGIYAFSILLAGIQGAPFYGIVKAIAELIHDDEDEPFDFDVYIAQQFGNELYGGPINRVLNIDMSRRTAFRDMVFRTDEARLEKLGLFSYGLETLAGPSGSIAIGTLNGLKETFEDGFDPSIRKTEQMLPTALRNSLKAYRQATEGVVNRRGISIADDPSLSQSVMQVFGFTSWEVSQAYRKANALKGPERKLYKRRSKLLLKYWLASQANDLDALNDIRDDIATFNSKAPKGFKISNDTIRRSMSNRRKLEKRAYNGVDVRNLRELQDIYGIPED